MANKFTKSVLERQYQESRRRVTPAPQAESEMAAVPPAAAKQEEAMATPSHRPSKAKSKAASIAPDAENQGAQQESEQPLAPLAQGTNEIPSADPGESPANRQELGESTTTQTPDEHAASDPNAGVLPRVETLTDEGDANAEEPEASAEASLHLPGIERVRKSQPSPPGAPKKQTMGQEVPDLVESYLIRRPERVAKNKTFYLDETVISGIRAAAKKQKVTESKLVNDILRGVLGVRE